MPIITLTTDFGTKDYTVSAVKGKLLSLIDTPIIIDISHRITAYNIPEAAYILNASYPNFPEESIHIIGVNAEKTAIHKHIVAQIDNHFFIGADNGIFSLLSNRTVTKKFIQILHPKSDTSTFPVLDVFTDIAALLSQSKNINSIGTPMAECKIWKINRPNITDENELLGTIVYVDRFGNLVTDVAKHIFDDYGQGKPFEIQVSREHLTKIHEKYDSFIDYSLPPLQRQRDGKTLAIFNAQGFLEIALYKSNPKRGGSASSLLGLDVGDTIKIIFK